MAAVRACLHRDVIYRHHLPAGAWPIAGIVRGKDNLAQSLSHFLNDFDVIKYCPVKIALDEGIWVSRVAFLYGHKLTGHTFEGTARTKALIEGDKIRSFEVIHDAARLRAFYELVCRMGIEA